MSKKRKINDVRTLKVEIGRMVSTFIKDEVKKKHMTSDEDKPTEEVKEVITVDNPLNEHCCIVSGGIFVIPCTLRCGHSFESMSIYKLIGEKERFACPTCKKKYDTSDGIISDTTFISDTIDRFYPGYREKELKENPQDYCRLDECIRSSIYDGNRALEDINVRKKIIVKKWYENVKPFIDEMVSKAWVTFFTYL